MPASPDGPEGEPGGRVEPVTGAGPDMPERKSRFPRGERLRTRQAFRRIYDHGDAHRGRFLIVIALSDDALDLRVGFVSSRKVAKAVGRNRARRLMREAYRRLRSEFTPKGRRAHYVLIARRAIVDAGLPDVKAEMRALLASAGALEPGKDHGI